jgi:dolichol kinase
MDEDYPPFVLDSTTLANAILKTENLNEPQSDLIHKYLLMIERREERNRRLRLYMMLMSQITGWLALILNLID